MSGIIDKLAVDNSLQIQNQLDRLEKMKEKILADLDNMDTKEMVEARQSISEIDVMIGQLRFPDLSEKNQGE